MLGILFGRLRPQYIRKSNTLYYETKKACCHSLQDESHNKIYTVLSVISMQKRQHIMNILDIRCPRLVAASRATGNELHISVRHDSASEHLPPRLSGGVGDDMDRSPHQEPSQSVDPFSRPASELGRVSKHAC